MLPPAGTVATGSGGAGCAVAGQEMAAGVHCAHFALREAASYGGLPGLGVVGAGFDAASHQDAWRTAGGWMLTPSNGSLTHGGKSSDWAGKVAAKQLKVGDVIVRSSGPPPCAVLASGC